MGCDTLNNVFEGLLVKMAFDLTSFLNAVRSFFHLCEINSLFIIVLKLQLKTSSVFQSFRPAFEP